MSYASLSQINKPLRVKPLIAAIRYSFRAINVYNLTLSTLLLGSAAIMTSANAGQGGYTAAENSNKAAGQKEDNTEQGIETILVTSGKHAENIQDTASSITAFGAAALEELEISSFQDYALLLPSVSFQTSGPGRSQVYMRGVSDGGDGNASGALPSVAIYLDEQPVTAIGRNLDVHIYDMERIEALAGPQSTLFGASSQAGTLRIITNKPDPDAFEGQFDLGFGSTYRGDTSYSLDGFVNIPLAENSAIRLVAWKKEEGGYIDNVAGSRTYALLTDGGRFSTVEESNEHLLRDDFNELSNEGARAALKINLDENWTAIVGYLGQKQDSQGVWFHDPQSPQGGVGDLEVQRFLPDSMEDKFDQATLTVEGLLGEAQLVYAGSFMERDVEYFNDYTDYADYFSTNWIQYYGCEYYGTADVDCTSMAIFHYEDNHYKRNSHEVRLQSVNGHSLQYLVGLYYEDTRHDYRHEWQMEGLAKGGDFSPFGQDNLWYLTDQVRKDRETALFGEFSYGVNEQIRFTVGARYFKNDSRLSGISGYGLIAPGFPILDVDISDDDSDSIFKFNVSYKPDDHKMFYLTWSEGYRPGGINRDESSLVERIYNPDIVTNTELGWKTMWLDNKLRWNGALYHMPWDDMQFTRYDLSFDTPVAVTINASEAKIVGLESQITYLLTDDWTLSAAFSFNQAELAKDLLVGSNFSPEGTQLPNVPEFKANIINRYDFTLGELNSFAQFVYSYVGESHNDIFKFSDNNSQIDKRQVNGSYGIVNFSVGVNTDNWGVNFTVNNLTDKRAQLSRGSSSWDSTETVVRPRYIGISYYRRFE